MFYLDTIEDDDEIAKNSTMVSKDFVEPEFKMRIPKSAKTTNVYHDIHKSTSKDGKILLYIPDHEAV